MKINNIKPDITIHELATHPILGKYFINLCYGWDAINDNRSVCDLYPDIWPIDKMIESLNQIIELEKVNNVQLIFPFSNSDVSALFIKNKPNSKVAFVYSGGAYCCVCNMVEGLPVAMELFKQGYSIVVGTYSIKNNDKPLLFEKPITDIIGTIRYFYENAPKLEIDMKDYIIGGFSAGGHAVGELLTDNVGLTKYGMDLPKLLFLGYPVITMHTNVHSYSRIMLIGENPSLEDMDKYSIEKHLCTKGCKVYVWQCKRDNQVPIENTIKLAEALQAKKYNFIYRTYDSDAHGYGIGANKICDGWVNEMLAFCEGN